MQSHVNKKSILIHILFSIVSKFWSKTVAIQICIFGSYILSLFGFRSIFCDNDYFKSSEIYSNLAFFESGSFDSRFKSSSAIFRSRNDNSSSFFLKQKLDGKFGISWGGGSRLVYGIRSSFRGLNRLPTSSSSDSLHFEFSSFWL